MIKVGIKSTILKVKLVLKGLDRALGLSQEPDDPLYAFRGVAKEKHLPLDAPEMVVLDVGACASRLLAKTNPTARRRPAPEGLSSALGHPKSASGCAASVMVRTSQPSSPPAIRSPTYLQQSPLMHPGWVPKVRPLPSMADRQSDNKRLVKLASRTTSADQPISLRSVPSTPGNVTLGSRRCADRVLSRTMRRVEPSLTQSTKPEPAARRSVEERLNELREQSWKRTLDHTYATTPVQHMMLRTTMRRSSPGTTLAGGSHPLRNTPVPVTACASSLLSRTTPPAPPTPAQPGFEIRDDFDVRGFHVVCGGLDAAEPPTDIVSAPTSPPASPPPLEDGSAAVMLQAFWKRKLAVRDFEHMKSGLAEAAAMRDAATKLQSFWRKRKAMQGMVRLKAVLRLQTAYRQRSRRKKLYLSVVRMQTSWRARVAKRKVNQVRKQSVLLKLSNKTAPNQPTTKAAADAKPRLPLKRSVTVQDLKAKQRPTLRDLYAFETEELKKIGHPERTRVFFDIPKADYIEPERTNRLLERPWSLRRDRAGDAYEQLKTAWIKECNGDKRAGIFFWFLLALVNVLLAALSSLGAALAKGSYLGYAQVGTIMTLQLGFALFCFSFTPDSDRVVGILHGCQFFVEGVSTSLNFAGSIIYPFDEEGTQIEERQLSKIGLFLYAFQLALLAMAVPMLAMLEKAVISPMLGGVLKKGCLGFIRSVCCEKPRALASKLVSRAAKSSKRKPKKKQYEIKEEFLPFPEGHPQLWIHRAPPHAKLPRGQLSDVAKRITASKASCTQQPSLDCPSPSLSQLADRCASRLYQRTSAANQPTRAPQASPRASGAIIGAGTLNDLCSGMQKKASKQKKTAAGCSLASCAGRVVHRTAPTAKFASPSQLPQVGHTSSHDHDFAGRVLARTIGAERRTITKVRPASPKRELSNQRAPPELHPSPPLRRSPRASAKHVGTFDVLPQTDIASFANALVKRTPSMQETPSTDMHGERAHASSPRVGANTLDFLSRTSSLERQSIRLQPIEPPLHPNASFNAEMILPIPPRQLSMTEFSSSATPSMPGTPLGASASGLLARTAVTMESSAMGSDILDTLPMYAAGRSEPIPCKDSFAESPGGKAPSPDLGLRLPSSLALASGGVKSELVQNPVWHLEDVESRQESAREHEEQVVIRKQ